MANDMNSFDQGRSIDWLDLLKRRYKVGLAVFVPVFVVSFLGASYFNRVEPVYLSYTQLLIERSAVGGVAAKRAIMTKQDMHNIITVFKSEPVFKKASHVLAEEFGYEDLSESHYAAKLKASVNVDSTGDKKRVSGGVVVSARTISPELSFDMVTAMVQAYKQHLFDIEQKKIRVRV